MEHRLPNRYYENSEDRYFKTTGAYVREKKQENFTLENTNRIETTKRYMGISGRDDTTKASAPQNYRKSNQISYANDYKRNLGSQVNKEKAKENYNIQETMRDLSGNKTVVNNRINVNQGNTILPDDKASKTNKQYLSSKTRSGQIIGSQKPTEYFDDAPDETKRELLEHLTRTGVIKGNKGNQVYNLNELDPTIKETLIDKTRTGGVSMNEKNTLHYFDKANTTIKETLVDKTRTGAVAMDEKPTLHNYETPDVTIKETLIDKTRTGGVAMDEKPTLHNYETPDVTIKETLIDKTRTGAINETNVQQILPFQDKAKTTIKETFVDKTRTGTISGENQASVYNLQKASETNRQYTSRAYAGAAKDAKEAGYLNENFDAKETMRQSTSDIEYFGTAESNLKQNTNRASSRNMRTNQFREKVLKERAPTQTGVKIASGREKISMDHRKMEREEHYQNLGNLQIIHLMLI